MILKLIQRLGNQVLKWSPVNINLSFLLGNTIYREQSDCEASGEAGLFCSRHRNVYISVTVTWQAQRFI
jgi:hypothetical protein